MASFSIYGTCICRDLFGFNENNRHNVVSFLQDSSPITNFKLETKPQDNLTFDKFGNSCELSNFKKKCIINDYNKTLKSYYKDKSDFFILDVVKLSTLNLCKETNADGTTHYFTRSQWFKTALKSGLLEYFNSKNSILESVNRFDILDDDCLNEIFDNLIDWLHKELNYSDEQIIIVENKQSTMYVENDALRFFTSGDIGFENEFLDKVYCLLEKKLPKCWIIHTFDNLYSVTEHPWGLSPLHFCREYYDYLYECIDAIADGKTKNTIDTIYRKYARIINNNFFEYYQNSISLIESVNMIPDFSEKKYFENHYITKCSGVKLFKDGIQKETSSIIPVEYQLPNGKCTINNTQWNVSLDDILRGYVGSGIKLKSGWYTQNKTTCVLFGERCIKLMHSGIDSNAQVNLLFTLQNELLEKIRDKYVTFSVWTRCKKISNYKNMGGLIGFIEKSDYNDGQFLASTKFRNTEFERITLTIKVPKEAEGLTLCLRSYAGVGDSPENSIVEFTSPKLEMGVFAVN